MADDGTPDDQPHRWTEYVRLADIAAAPRNPKQHAGKEIQGSLTRFGLAELPTIDERTNRLVAGHGRLDQLTAARNAGDPPPRYVRVDTDGEWLIPVSRGWSSDDDTAAAAYLVASNHLTTMGGWDRDELGPMLAGINTVDPALFAATGFTDAELAAMLAPPPGEDDNPGGGGAGGAGADTSVRPGDIWHLGAHRLTVGGDDHLGIVTRMIREWQIDTGQVAERLRDGRHEPIDFDDI
jgi:hypothetical protein